MRTRQDVEKLALIPSILYIKYDLSGVEKPLYKNLINNIFSQKAGEKRFNLSKPTLPSLFKGAVASTVLASTMFVGTAYATDAPHNNAPVQNASVTQNSIEFHDDANLESSQWVANHPNRVAVAIRYGGKTKFTPEQIENVLKTDFEKNEIFNAVFYWEHGESDKGTGIMIETDGVAYGPYGLGKVREVIATVSSQIKFNRRVDMAQAPLFD